VSFGIFLYHCVCSVLYFIVHAAFVRIKLMMIEDSGGTRNRVLDGGPDPPMGRGNFEGEGAAHCKV